MLASRYWDLWEIAYDGYAPLQFGLVLLLPAALLFDDEPARLLQHVAVGAMPMAVCLAKRMG